MRKPNNIPLMLLCLSDHPVQAEDWMGCLHSFVQQRKTEPAWVGQLLSELPGN